MLKNFKAYQFSKKLYFECEKLSMRDFLKTQLLRAASSVVLNLAEGSGKPSFKDKRRFYYIALGSLREVQAILEISLADEDLVKLADEAGACVYGLIRLNFNRNNL